jgi:hypothetical protein
MKTAWLLPTVLLTGCVIGTNKYKRPSELDSATLIDRVRILAIQAEPPEARPGDEVHFSALIADPNDEVDTVVWLACPPDEAGGFGCAVDLSSLGDSPTPEELAAAGVIGFEPGFPPVYVPPADLLDDLPEAERAEGLSVTVQIAAFPSTAVTDSGTTFFDDVEVAYKRLVVSEATTPNHNPVIGAFTVDGFAVPPDSTAEVDAGQAYELGISLTDASLEHYTYVDRDGVAEDRVEEPYATWACTGGEVTEGITLFPYTQSTWVSPTDVSDVTCWSVVRDRRGGMTWAEQQLTIR